MDSITLLNDTLFLKNDTLYAKLGDLTMNHKYIAESNGCGWTNVVIWFLVCTALVCTAYIVTKYLKEQKNNEYENNKSLKEKEREYKGNEKKEEIKATYRSKILDYLKDNNVSKGNPYLNALFEFLKKQGEEYDMSKIFPSDSSK